MFIGKAKHVNQQGVKKLNWIILKMLSLLEEKLIPVG